MFLAPGGIDVFYVDESGRHSQFVFTSVTIPLLREEPQPGFLSRKRWRFVWDDHLDAYRQFRRLLRTTHGIPVRKELHAFKLAAGRGGYSPAGGGLGPTLGCAIYRWILQRLDQFLPPASVITVVGSQTSNLYGATGQDACLLALFQRMQRQCVDARRNTNGLTFFDQGHGEYLKAYRKARRYLPTGSAAVGGWSTGLTKNLEMKNFFKDGNFKDSKFSLFVQAADLIAYAATMLLAKEAGTLTAWQKQGALGDAYDDIPPAVLNLSAAGVAKDPRGLVRL
ncbi:MAG: DUF3800 domain-containing protein [Thermoleophilia bacterium]|nr:DUF3800 domain-containing protein [Thermoleophilia bacterium]